MQGSEYGSWMERERVGERRRRWSLFAIDVNHCI